MATCAPSRAFINGEMSAVGCSAYSHIKQEGGGGGSLLPLDINQLKVSLHLLLHLFFPLYGRTPLHVPSFISLYLSHLWYSKNCFFFINWIHFHNNIWSNDSLFAKWCLVHHPLTSWTASQLSWCTWVMNTVAILQRLRRFNLIIKFLETATVSDCVLFFLYIWIHFPLCHCYFVFFPIKNFKPYVIQTKSL